MAGQQGPDLVPAELYVPLGLILCHTCGSRERGLPMQSKCKPEQSCVHTRVALVQRGSDIVPVNVHGNAPNDLNGARSRP